MPRIRVAGKEYEREEFLLAVAKKDSEALASLVSQIQLDKEDEVQDAPGLVLVSLAFRGEVIRFLQGLVQGDEQLALEAWNDTLFRVHSRISAYDKRKSNFVTWLYNQARYSALDVLRREGLQARGIALDWVEHEDHEWLLHPKQTRALRRAIGRLRPAERRILELHFVRGLSYPEIASEYLAPLPVEHARVYGHRATKRLRRFFEEELSMETT